MRILSLVVLSLLTQLLPARALAATSAEVGNKLAEHLHRSREEAVAGFEALDAAMTRYETNPDVEAPAFAQALLDYLAPTSDLARQEFVFAMPRMLRTAPRREKMLLSAVQLANLVYLDWLRTPQQLAIVPHMPVLARALDQIMRTQILGEGPLPTFPTAGDFYQWMTTKLKERLGRCDITAGEDDVLRKGDQVLGYFGSAVPRRGTQLSAVLEYWTDDRGQVVAAASNWFAHTNIYFALSNASKQLTHDFVAGTRVGLWPDNPNAQMWDEQEGYTLLCGTAPASERLTPPYYTTVDWNGQTLIPIPDSQLWTLKRYAAWSDMLVCSYRRWVEPLGKLYCNRT